MSLPLFKQKLLLWWYYNAKSCGLVYKRRSGVLLFFLTKVWFKRNEFALKLLLWCYHIYKILYKQTDCWRFLLSEYFLFVPFYCHPCQIKERNHTFPFLLYFIIIFKMLPWRPLIRQRPSCRLCWLSLYYRAASAPVRCLCATSETGTLSVDWAPFPCHTMYIPKTPNVQTIHYLNIL